MPCASFFYLLPLPAALPIWLLSGEVLAAVGERATADPGHYDVRPVPTDAGVENRDDVWVLESRQDRSLTREPPGQDRKSTRLNSSHLGISYAVFCLKKKTNI